MKDYVVDEPETFRDALELLATDDDVRAIAGGTGLTPLARYGFFEPTRLVSLRRLERGHAGIHTAADGSLSIGALARLRDLEVSASVAEHAPVIVQALRRLSNIRVRNIATLGGSLAHGHPQMDLPPVLIALDATVHVRHRDGDRWLPVEDLLLGYYETALAPGELIAEVRIPDQRAAVSGYRKLTARTYEDWPMLGLAARVGVHDGRLRDVRIAVGALSDRAQRVEAAEQMLDGGVPTPDVIAAASTAAADAVRCSGDSLASEEYRRALVRVHLNRLVTELVDVASNVPEDAA